MDLASPCYHIRSDWNLLLEALSRDEKAIALTMTVGEHRLDHSGSHHRESQWQASLNSAMNLPHIALGWLQPSLNLAATLATAVTIAAPMAPSALSNELPLAQQLNDGVPLQEETTQFVPENHKGIVCMALAPQCMTKKQWAAFCISQSNGSPNLLANGMDPETNLMESKSCRDALDRSAPD